MIFKLYEDAVKIYRGAECKMRKRVGGGIRYKPIRPILISATHFI